MNKLKKMSRHPILKIVLWLYACISLYPLFWTLFYSLKSNQEIFVTNPFGVPRSLKWATTLLL